MVVEIKDDTFDQEIKKVKIALVDFWAPWCGPCQMMLPLVDELSKEIGDKAMIAKVNVDENPQIAQRFGIMSIPCFIIFKDGEQVKQLVGVQSKDSLAQEIENA